MFWLLQITHFWKWGALLDSCNSAISGRIMNLDTKYSRTASPWACRLYRGRLAPTRRPYPQYIPCLGQPALGTFGYSSVLGHLPMSKSWKSRNCLEHANLNIWISLRIFKCPGASALGTKMYQGLPALKTVLYSRLTALGPKMYIGLAALGTKVYPRLPALKYRVVCRAACPEVPCCTQGRQPLVQKCT